MDRAPGFGPGGWGFESLSMRLHFLSYAAVHFFTDSRLHTAGLLALCYLFYRLLSRPIDAKPYCRLCLIYQPYGP